MVKIRTLSGGGACLALALVLLAGDAVAASGKEIAFDASRGDCLSCHAMPTLADAVPAGNSGPPLIAMTARFPDRQALRAKLWDATASNPDTMMPPYGRHKVLTEDEIDKVLEFIYGL